MIGIGAVALSLWLLVRELQSDHVTPDKIGELLLTKFLLPFEVASFLLLIAAVGAVVLARRRGGIGEDDADRIAVMDFRLPPGIGTMAVQLAARAGARVLCTVGSAEKAARAVELGAERAVRYRDEDFVAVVRGVTGGAGADVVLDNMGAAYLPRNVEALAVGGRLVVIGLQGGARGELDLGALLVKRASVHATSLRARPAAEKAAIVAAVRAHVWPAVEAGEVRPVIDRVLPLDDAAQAHRVLESSAHIGKIVLTAR